MIIIVSDDMLGTLAPGTLLSACTKSWHTRPAPRMPHRHSRPDRKATTQMRRRPEGVDHTA